LFNPCGAQKSNSLVSWGLNTAESSVQAALQTTLHAVIVMERPIAVIDSILCKSLDIVEERVPLVTLPPGQVSIELKPERVSDKSFQSWPSGHNCSSVCTPVKN